MLPKITQKALSRGVKLATISNYLEFDSFSLSDFSRFLILVNAEANKPVGTATTPRPSINITKVKIFPPAVIG